ncbi:MAG TPA: hypothetical protein VFX59_29995 [Polyangiales bacterium]|nr:hypothetical protein [Polyangiales bacterium]
MDPETNPERERQAAAQVARFAEFSDWLQLEPLYKCKAGTKGLHGMARADALRRVLNWAAMRASGDPSSSPFRNLGVRVIRPKTALGEILERAQEDARSQPRPGAPSAEQIEQLSGAFRDYLLEAVRDPALDAVLAPRAIESASCTRLWLIWAAALLWCVYLTVRMQSEQNECRPPPDACPQGGP